MIRAVLVALVLALGLGSAAMGRELSLGVGALAPDFRLIDQHGQPFRLSDVLARRDFVVIAFFVQAFTGG